jgi:hypothetical protein
MRTFSITTLLLLTASVAGAADNGIYLGGGIVRSGIDASRSDMANTLNNSVDLDDDSTGFKAIVGIRPLDWLAAEVNYIDLGEVSSNSGTVHAAVGLKGVDAFAVFLFDLPFVDFYAKGGFIRWDASLDSNITAVDTGDDSGVDAAYGAGTQVRFGSLAARLEYERFEIEGTEETSAITLGVTWTFL